MSFMTATGRVNALNNAIKRRLIILALLVAAADFLFFRHSPGISVAIFLVSMAFTIIMSGGATVHWRKLPFASVFLGLCLLPIVENVNALSMLLAICGICLFAATAMATDAYTLYEQIASAVRLLFIGVLQFPLDVIGRRSARLKEVLPTFRTNVFIVWIVPILLGSVFVLFFAAANPLIQSLIVMVRFEDLFSFLDPLRFIFWAIALVLLWPFVFYRAWRYRTPPSPQLQLPGSKQESLILGEGAILRSLVLFNLIFALQTSLDIAYLWGGAELPKGVTYAQYAQRGAYALIATALVSAAFLLVAMRPGRAAERSKFVRYLVYLWTAQNLLLMISATMRLYTYVGAYSLTYQRIFAFVLIFLIGCGFLLIAMRIAAQRSNTWLVAGNGAILAVVAYGCAFVNFPYMIADFNIRHSREVAGKGVALDAGYIESLGIHALAAYDGVEGIWRPTYQGVMRAQFSIRRDMQSYIAREQNWRSWTYRDWRLRQYWQKRLGGADPR